MRLRRPHRHVMAAHRAARAWGRGDKRKLVNGLRLRCALRRTPIGASCLISNGQSGPSEADGTRLTT